MRLGKDAVAAQVQLSAQISGPLADQLRKHSEAAGALAIVYRKTSARRKKR